MGQAGVGDQNMNGSSRNRRSELELVKQEQEIRTWMGQAGLGDPNMNGSDRSRRSEHGWVRQE